MNDRLSANVEQMALVLRFVDNSLKIRGKNLWVLFHVKVYLEKLYLKIFQIFYEWKIVVVKDTMEQEIWLVNFHVSPLESGEVSKNAIRSLWFPYSKPLC